MVDRYKLGEWKDCDGDWFSIPMVIKQDGRWVKYKDYEKLADLCGRMAEILKCVPNNNSSTYSRLCGKLHAEWEAMK